MSDAVIMERVVDRVAPRATARVEIPASVRASAPTQQPNQGGSKLPWWEEIAEEYKRLLGSAGYWYGVLAEGLSVLWNAAGAIGAGLRLPGFRVKSPEQHAAAVTAVDGRVAEVQAAKTFDATHEARNARGLARMLAKDRTSVDEDLWCRVRPETRSWLEWLHGAELAAVADAKPSDIILSVTGYSKISGVRSPGEVASGAQASPTMGARQPGSDADALRDRVAAALAKAPSTPALEPELEETIRWRR